MRIRLGLLDDDMRYLNRLTDYFGVHYTMQIEANLFTEVEELQAFLNQRGRLDVLLASRELLPDPSILPKRIQLAYLSEENGLTMLAGKPAVCKYQKAEAIYRAVQGLAASLDMGEKKYASGGNCEVFLFAGAAGGVGCSTAAMGCAARLAAQGRSTIYISLQQTAMIESVFRTCGASMSRVRYEIKSWKQSGHGDTDKLQMKLQSLLATDPDTHVMCCGGFELPLEAMDMDAGEVEALLKAVAGLCDCCVLDMDGRLNGMLLSAIRGAAWTVLVSDGSTRGNRGLEGLIRSIEILDSTDEPVLHGRLGVLYNRFGSAAAEAELPVQANLLGKVPNYAGSAEKRIVQELIGSGVYTLLES